MVHDRLRLMRPRHHAKTPVLNHAVVYRDQTVQVANGRITSIGRLDETELPTVAARLTKRLGIPEE